jgi:hypothetical protein
MPNHLPEISNTVLQYTVVAANALRDLGNATQIPFIVPVCSLALAVVPLIQVGNWQYSVVTLPHRNGLEYQISEGTMPSDGRRYSSCALCIDGSLC